MDVNRKATPAPHVRTPQSPPRTPRAGTKRNSGMHRTPRDNFFDRLTDNARGADADDATPNSRISHDLSLTANIGRSSVVENMLLSLNPNQPRLESPPYPTPSCFSSTESPRSRGHIASSSLSSDYSFPSPPSNSRPSSHRPARYPRGRRSNSSNFQSLSRIDSLTTDEEKVDARRTKAYQLQRADLAGQTSVPASRSGGKSSKSSGSSSVDFGHMMRQSAIPRRSASFDDGRRRPSFPISSSFSQPLIHSNIEAAPTPTVPSGPRSPSIPISAPPQAAPTSSKRTFRNPAAKRSKADVSKRPIGQKPDSFPDSQHMPASAFQALRPASPAKDRSDVQDPHQRPPSQARAHAKDKPGFFRRVFKSGNSHSTSQATAFSQPLSSQNSVRAGAQGVMAPPSQLPKSGLSAEMTCPPKANAPLPLAKKPSSFFRRRKKSASENISTPVPTPGLHSDLHPPDPIMKHNPSMSSLRELMNPYLSSSPDARKGSAASSHDNASKMSKIPVEKSTVKAVFPQPAGDKSTSNVARHARQVDDSKSEDAAGAKADVSLDGNHVPRDQSFLHDNSSNIPPPATIVDPSMLENPMIIHATPDDPMSVELEQSAQSSNAAAQSAQLVMENVPKSKSRKPRTKMPRSRTISGDKPSTSGTAGQPATTALNPTKETVIAAVTPGEATPRVWLRPERSTEDLRRLAETSLPDLDAQSSQAGDDRPSSSRRSRLAAVTTTAPELPKFESSDPKSPDFDATLPFREDRVLAQRIFEGDEGLVPKPKAAAWLGEAGHDRARIRRAYMELFNWQNFNILAALRDFCGRLLLKGETQQVDRVLDAFSSRWCACNPNHGFKATGGVVYNPLTLF
ncbi:MAG: hypothetical protein Q9181_004958 [Wetmoreana brouardii]